MSCIMKVGSDGSLDIIGGGVCILSYYFIYQDGALTAKQWGVI